MSLPFIRIYSDKELDGIAIHVLNDAEYGVWVRIRCLASRTSDREGFLEYATGIPLTDKDIAHRILARKRITTTTIQKCLKWKLLEKIDGVLHVRDWEVDQLNKNQRSAIHRAIERGKQTVEIPEGKPLKRDFVRGK